MKQLHNRCTDQGDQSQAGANEVDFDLNSVGAADAALGECVQGHSYQDSRLTGMGFGGVAGFDQGIWSGRDWQVSNVRLDDSATTVSAWSWGHPAAELAGVSGHDQRVLSFNNFNASVGDCDGSERVDDGQLLAVYNQLGPDEQEPSKTGGGCGDGCGCGKSKPIASEQRFNWKQDGQQKHGAGKSKIAYWAEDLTFKHVSILAESSMSQGGIH